MPDLCEAAYAAGLFDGEGCVQLYMRPTSRSRASLSTALSMSSVQQESMQWIQERWGGSTKVYDETWRIERGHRPLYRWVAWSNEAEAFARDILPFLITKREQIEVWLEARALLRPHRSGRGDVTPDELAIRRALVDRVKQLKKVA